MQKTAPGRDWRRGAGSGRRQEVKGGRRRWIRAAAAACSCRTRAQERGQGGRGEKRRRSRGTRRPTGLHRRLGSPAERPEAGKALRTTRSGGLCGTPARRRSRRRSLASSASRKEQRRRGGVRDLAQRRESSAEEPGMADPGAHGKSLAMAASSLRLLHGRTWERESMRGKGNRRRKGKEGEARAWLSCWWLLAELLAGDDGRELEERRRTWRRGTTWRSSGGCCSPWIRRGRLQGRSESRWEMDWSGGENEGRREGGCGLGSRGRGFGGVVAARIAGLARIG